MSVTEQNVIARKISQNRVGRSPIPQIDRIGADLAKLLDERLRRLLKTMVSTLVVQIEVRKLSHVEAEIPVPAMLGIVRARNASSGALVHISNDLAFHLVDLRMGGDTQTAPVPAERTATALDCTLCSDVVTVVLQALTAAINLNAGADAEAWLTLDRFEQHVTMARIAAEHSDVLSLQLSLDIGDAARTGALEVVLPLSVLDSFMAASRRKPVERSVQSVDLWAMRMRHAALQAPAPMQAIMHRVQVDIASLQSWQPGDVIPIPARCREVVTMELRDRPGSPIAEGKLGALDGQKALRLSAPPDPQLVDHIRGVTGG
ncbi:MAG: FliM/FliN family flagellar motor switch protein [Pseudomonadota bacterium]